MNKPKHSAFVVCYGVFSRSINLKTAGLQKVDSDIHWKNLYPGDNAIGFPNTCLLDNLTGG